MDEITKRQVTIMKKRRKEMGFSQCDIAEKAGIHTGFAKTAISKCGKMQKLSCFYIFLREKSPFYDAVCDETPYVHRC